MLAGTYAPELKLLGVAAMAPASDLAGLLEAGAATGFGKLVSAFLFEAYSKVYPDMDDTYVSASGRILASDIARRCIVDRGVLWSIADVWLLPRDGLFVRPVGQGELGRHLRENTPMGPIAAPLLLAQGAADDAVRPELQRRYVAARCAAGEAVDYREFPGLDHMGLVALDSPLVPQLIDWTKARFDGQARAVGCPGL